ncbi:MAG TPA: ester cyclase [Ignavibacteria bacterium]|nr:ester cyclase [Ignavibacteria bacterium]
MDLEENKKIVQEFYHTIINEKKIDFIGQYLTDDFVHNGEQRGIKGQKEAVQMFIAAFPDLQNTIEVSLAEEDLVAVHETWKGTHEGEFMGVPATKTPVNWQSTAILKIRGGKICEAWDVNDFLSLFQEIGKYPQE